MFKTSLRTVAVLVLLALGGCSGKEPFQALPGPYDGLLVVNGQNIGTISFTVTDQLIGGTGMLVLLGDSVIFALSGAIVDKSIQGSISNSAIGSGPFTGSFQNTFSATGTFSFVDELENRLDGTWTAVASD